MRSPRLRRHTPPPKASPASASAVGFSTGDEVEVLLDEPPRYRGAHLPAVVTRSSPSLRSYTVAYDAFVESGRAGPPSVVQAPQVRPRPPAPPRAPPPPPEHAVVDAFDAGAWWVGVAVGGDPSVDGRVVVCFPETREVREFDAANVRPHLEWVAGEWLTPKSMEIPKTVPYTKGTRVEVAKLEDNSVVAWFTAVVAKAIWKNSILVEYVCSKSDGSAVSKEIVDIKHIRPCLPHAPAINFCINDEVEAFQGDGWWLGVIAEVHPKLRYTFKSSHLGKEVQLDQNAIRLRYDWIHGQWQQVSPNLWRTNFTEGCKVEVSSNDEGFQGAWFEGTVLKSVGYKFSVEYDALKDDDETTPLIEDIDLHNIRPSPPDIPVINGFKLLDEVDAFCNDGWWVGVVCKVISDQSYMVYFKPWKEEREFGHEQLRVHCDWMGGRWMRTSLATMH